MMARAPLASLAHAAGKKVFVGLSGGVDSAVTAAVLQEAGAEVTCVFIKGWYPPGMPCTWADDRRDALRVAAHLRLPFHTLDASKEYKEGVIDYLLREYRAGRTPNPDIMCNRDVKFGAFYSFARAQGADFIATGHYARDGHAESGKGTLLRRGVDDAKDQSYFLWAVPSEALANALFPLGSLEKPRVRELAAHYGLPNAQKRDSQGICFLGSVSIEEFLEEEFGSEPGRALDAHGMPIGIHAGVLRSTPGQKVALTDALPGPWYVLSKDVAANVLVVAKALQTDIRNTVALIRTNWFREPSKGVAYDAQYRYHGPRVRGRFDRATSTFIPDAPITEPIASGQSLVLYDDDECLGGGIIG